MKQETLVDRFLRSLKFLSHPQWIEPSIEENIISDHEQIYEIIFRNEQTLFKIKIHEYMEDCTFYWCCCSELLPDLNEYIHCSLDDVIHNFRLFLAMVYLNPATLESVIMSIIDTP